MNPLLQIDALERSFGGRDVVGSLSLSVDSGERVALTGPNGSGKTTVLRCVAGTLAATAGSIRVAGRPAGSVQARQISGVSLSQERAFYLRLSGRENLLFYARLRGSARDVGRRVAALEDELELRPILDQRVDRCSTGMIQQLSFARALLGEPQLLLLDEPTRSLDTDACARFWNALERRRDAALVIATHDEEDVHRCERRVDIHSPPS